MPSSKTKDPEVGAEGATGVASPSGEPGTAVAQVNQGVSMDQLMQDGKAAALVTDRKDLAIPFLRVLQSNSPQVDRDKAQYVKGAEAGMFINTVTGKLWPGREGGVVVAVVAYQRNYTEWKPRGSSGEGGGFIKDWGKDDSNYLRAQPAPEKKSRMVTPEGTEMVQSGMYFLYAVDPATGAFEQLVLALAGTQLKKSRRWNSLIKTEQVIHPVTKVPFSPPPFYRLYRLTTVPEQNDQGSWKGLKVEPDITLFEVPNGGLLYQEAMRFKGDIDEGKVKTVAPDAEFGDDPAAAGGQTRDPGDDGDDAPF